MKARKNIVNFCDFVRERSTKYDTYHIALFYTLGINPDTRNIHEIYDFKANRINLNALRKGWQTSGSYQVCLLAFNLFNGYAKEGDTSKSQYTL